MQTNPLVRLAMLLGTVLAVHATSAAQSGGSAVGSPTLRSRVDTAFAVQLRLAEFVERLRNPSVGGRRLPDATMAGAAVTLAGAAARAHHPPPARTELGILWDLRFDDVQVVSSGPAGLTVTAVISLVASTAPSQIVTFHFRRDGDDWILDSTAGLVRVLLAWAQSNALGGPQ